MHKRIIFLLLILFANIAFGQNKKAKSDCTGRVDSITHKLVYTYAEIMPEPIGGMNILFNRIFKELKSPPSDAQLVGKVVVGFIVDADGAISGTRTIYDPSGKKNFVGDQICEIVNKMKWRPGRCNNKRVPVFYTLPVYINWQEN